MPVMVSIIIVNYNGMELTRQCLRSIYSSAIACPFEIIIVDNASIDGSVDRLKNEFSNIKIVTLRKNVGFGAANNAGVVNANGEYVFFLNNDTELQNDVLTPLIKHLEVTPQAGIVAPALCYGDGSFQLSFGSYPSIWNELRTRRYQRNEQQQSITAPTTVDWVTGAAMCMNRALFLQVGGFDEQYFMYFEDSDLCYRFKQAGYEMWYLPQYTLMHHKGKSYEKKHQHVLLEYRKSQLLYYALHQTRVQQILLRLYLFVKYTIYSCYPKTRAHARDVLLLTMKNK
jgi:GT2 family glycosyltransferase